MIVRAKTKRRLLIVLVVALIAGAAGVSAVVILIKRNHRTYAQWRAEGMAAYHSGDYATARLNLNRYIRREEYSKDVEAIYAFAQAMAKLDVSDGSNWAATARQLERLLVLRPERDDVRRQLLQYYDEEHLGYWSELKTIASTVLKQSPTDLDALRAVAFAHAGLGDNKLAIARLWDCLKAYPADLRANLLLEKLYYDSANRDSLALDPVMNPKGEPGAEFKVSDVLIRRAAALLQTCKGDDAGRAELLAVRAYGSVALLSAAQLAELAKIMLVRDPQAKTDADPVKVSVEAAKFFVRQAAKRKATDLQYTRILVREMEALRMVNEAADVMVGTDPNSQDRWVRQEIPRRLFEVGRFADLVQRFEKVKLQSSSSIDVELMGLKAIALVQLKREGEIAAIADALAGEKDDRIAQAWATLLKAKRLEPRSVVEAVRPAVDLAHAQPDRASSYLSNALGDAYTALGERELAIASYREAARLSPYWLLPSMHLSAVLLEAGRKEDAMRVAADVQQRTVTVAAAINLAVTWSSGADMAVLAKNADFVRLIMMIHDALPEDAQTLPIYVALLSQTKDRAAAEQALRDVLKASKPPSEALLLQLAAVSRQLNLNLEDAVYGRVEQAYGLTPGLALERAGALANRGKVEEGIKYLDDVRRQNRPPEQKLAWQLSWARFLDLALDPAKDQRGVEAWIAIGDDPANKDNLNVQRAALAARSVQQNQAFMSRTIERIRTITGDKGVGWRMAKARILFDDRKADPDYSQTIRMLNDVLESATNDVDVRVMLAAAMERSKDIPGAIAQMVEALKAQPQSSRLNFGLARLYLRLQPPDVGRARRQLDSVHAEDLEPSQQEDLGLTLAEVGDVTRALAILAKIPDEKVTPFAAVRLAELQASRGEPAKAEAVYARLLKKPDLKSIVSAANFYASTGRAREAEDVLKALATLNLPPGAREIAVGDYYASHGTTQQSLQQYEAAAKLQPMNDGVRRAIITQYLRDGKIAEALAAADQALLALPDLKGVKAFKDQAEALKVVGSQPRLFALIVSILQDAPESPIAIKGLHIISDAAKHGELTADAVSETVKRLRTLSDSAPKFAPLRIVLIDYYTALGRRDEAADLAQKCARDLPFSAEMARIAAIALDRAGERPAALAAARRWRELAGGPAIQADLLIARLLLNIPDAAGAIKQLEPYLAAAIKDPQKDNATVLVLESWALISRGEAEKAADLLWPLASKAAEWRQLWIERALMFRARPEIAAVWIDRVTELIPNDAIGEQALLASAWYELGLLRPAEAAKMSKAAIEAERDRRKPYRQKAITIMADLGQRVEEVAGAAHLRGVMEEQEFDFAAAERDYRAALKKQPNLPITLNNLAMIVARRGGDMTEAKALAAKAVEIAAGAPDAPSLYDTQAFVLAKAKDYPGAIKSIKESIVRDPRNAEWQIHLASLYQEFGQSADAAATIRNIDKLVPDKSILRDDQRERLKELRTKVGSAALPSP
jgi:tetratricopeptide (TPR) repeat protein